MPGISIITNFDVNENVPIDSRIVASNSTVRTNIQYKYEGLKVYQLDNQQSYIWDGFNWRVEYNGIYGGSGSIPGNTEINFGSVATTVGSSSNDLIFRADTISNSTNIFFKNDFIRHTQIIGLGNEWQGIEFRQQFQYKDSNPNRRNSSYISYNPPATFPGALAFGTGDSLSYQVAERMRISSDGKVGIATTDPKEFLQIGSVSTTRLPMVFNNMNDASIAYNWYYTTTDTFFDNARGSSRIKFTNAGDILFLTRNTNATTFNSPIIFKGGKVGIGSNVSPDQLLQIGTDLSYSPLTFHNDATLAAIGYNWKPGNGFFDNNKPHSYVTFEPSGAISFKNKTVGAVITYTGLHISTSGKVGINTTSIGAGYTLDVNGTIYGRSNIQAAIDIKAGNFVEAAAYTFNNQLDSVITIQGGIPQIFKIRVEGRNVLWSYGGKNVIFLPTEMIDSTFSILNTQQTNGILPNGIEFYNNQSATKKVGIYQYQEDLANNKHGISFIVTDVNDGRESFRISDGGKRVQIGVPRSVTGNHTLNSNSQIDTFNQMYETSNSRINLSNIDFNLIKSGYVSFVQSGQLQVQQYWQRIGLIVQVQLRAYRVVLSPLDSPFGQLNQVSISIPIGKADTGSLNGNFYSYKRQYGIPPITFPAETSTGIIKSWGAYDIKFNISDSNQAAEQFHEIYGSYTYLLVN